ncbi:2844_t:CDS:2 [Ambispora leptoticha]|uniref:2844_t:CDS:1 n=1 Tax=Ambispora leptoticha TaxID=144679 RepID=A0A9N9GLZ1_9GLOM|nr:2844_t:CDS:2 [Ambispora leptoticha]
MQKVTLRNFTEFPDRGECATQLSLLFPLKITQNIKCFHPFVEDEQDKNEVNNSTELVLDYSSDYEIDRIQRHHFIVKHVFESNFSCTVEEMLKRGARVLDGGLLKLGGYFELLEIELILCDIGPNMKWIMKNCIEGSAVLDLENMLLATEQLINRDAIGVIGHDSKEYEQFWQQCKA